MDDFYSRLKKREHFQQLLFHPKVKRFCRFKYGDHVFLLFPLQVQQEDIQWQHLTASVAHEVKNPSTYIQLAL